MISGTADHEGISGPQLPASDPSWGVRCAPLLGFLAMPRTWADLTVWGHEHAVTGCELRNMLAWLEDIGAARAFVRGDVHGWRRSLPRAAQRSSGVVVPIHGR
jgi:hypothetical protein